METKSTLDKVKSLEELLQDSADIIPDEVFVTVASIKASLETTNQIVSETAQKVSDVDAMVPDSVA